MDAKRWRKTLAYLIFLSIMGIALTACTSMNATSGGSSADGGAKTASPTVYRDFSDILLPNEMKIDPKRTYIVEGPGMTTGILTIKGWVDRNSLMTFFKSAMQRDQWQELASFKSPTPKTSSILVFQKAGRIAVSNAVYSISACLTVRRRLFDTILQRQPPPAIRPSAALRRRAGGLRTKDGHGAFSSR